MYKPKYVKGKLNFKNVTNEEIRKDCTCEYEVEVTRDFYNKLDGQILTLSLWDYDYHSSYHLSGWNKGIDNLMMEAMFILEKGFGVYSDFEEFKKIWEKDEYDPGCAVVFPKSCVEELEVLQEEVKEG